jgi:hypothetical protein
MTVPTFTIVIASLGLLIALLTLIVKIIELATAKKS